MSPLSNTRSDSSSGDCICVVSTHALHRHCNEKNWWTNFQIAPMEIARELWRASPIKGFHQMRRLVVHPGVRGLVAIASALKKARVEFIVENGGGTWRPS